MINLKSYYRLQNFTYISLVLLTCGVTFFVYRHVNISWLYFRQAEDLYSQKRFSEAIEFYKKSLEYKNNMYLGQLRLAESYAANGEFANAIIWYKLYLKDHPSDYKVYLALAKVLTWNQDFKEAEQIYKKLLNET